MFEAKDFLGNELKLGDEVVFMQKSYRTLMRGTIIKMSPKTCMIGHKKTNLCTTETRQTYDQLVLVK
jgi:hypothetical protein